MDVPGYAHVIVITIISNKKKEFFNTKSRSTSHARTQVRPRDLKNKYFNTKSRSTSRARTQVRPRDVNVLQIRNCFSVCHLNYFVQSFECQYVSKFNVRRVDVPRYAAPHECTLNLKTY